MVSNLDKAKVASDSVSAAMGSVVARSMQSLDKLPDGVDLADSVDQITQNAIEGTKTLKPMLSWLISTSVRASVRSSAAWSRT